jgi:hypothetical protein
MVIASHAHVTVFAVIHIFGDVNVTLDAVEHLVSLSVTVFSDLVSRLVVSGLSCFLELLLSYSLAILEVVPSLLWITTTFLIRGFVLLIRLLLITVLLISVVLELASRVPVLSVVDVCFWLHSWIAEDTSKQQKYVHKDSNCAYLLLPTTLCLNHEEHSDLEAEHHAGKDAKTDGEGPAWSDGADGKLAFVAAADEKAVHLTDKLESGWIVLYLLTLLLRLPYLYILTTGGALNLRICRYIFEILHLLIIFL